MHNLEGKRTEKLRFSDKFIYKVGNYKRKHEISTEQCRELVNRQLEPNDKTHMKAMHKVTTLYIMKNYDDHHPPLPLLRSHRDQILTIRGKWKYGVMLGENASQALLPAVL